ncbi:DEAD/DEAH box helicase [Floricoccus tropicus]|nr:DEAD/DEAH box helicase [Floricoccus tropicus]
MKDKIQSIINEKGKIIIVLKGFEIDKLPKNNKYFSFSTKYYDKVNLDIIKNNAIQDIIKNQNFEEEYRWMTAEEYQLFRQYSNMSGFPVVILENNLYNKQFPYQNTLSNIENIYHDLYYNEDSELSSEQERILENVSYFYGQIDYSKFSGSYFVTYHQFENDTQIYYLYENIPIAVEFSEATPIDNIERIELSENEIPFLDLESSILNGLSKQNIIFVLSESSDYIPNHYLERLNILNNFTDVNFYFSRLSIERQFIKNKIIYEKILKDIYGYDNFKDIAFYKNIENQSKETIDISQAQIIDDIVIQAEKAMCGDPFRDVYITASTGAGKSVMFQIPALYLATKYNDDKPLTLVISPLIGLMNDQVDSMRKKGIDSSATINGNTPPYEKEKILQKVNNQEIDVLYLSPETLQARSDIKMVIGNRKIGIVIIDEAHIVTTWGKSFRADYWYLGIYLAKLRKEYKFPIVTFTATAIYGGKEDMYLDTRNSLNMISPISYFGEVRRKDILMKVRSSEKDLDLEGRDYRKTKNTLALKHLKYAYKKKQKSLLYFPTVSLLNNFYDFIVQNDHVISEVTGKYYGTLSKEEKDEVLIEFKSGDLQFVLATKAFGMGIDIPDITNVYHYAPTGNVVDYIQEIGRAARDNSRVPYGFGMIDFLARDFNEVKQLHGMSAIKKTQIIEVMRKVLSIYKQSGNSRNLIISPEDFKYIFVQNKRDEDSLDNKVKTVLLMIEKDFSSPNKLGYSPFVARPRSLFGNDMIFVNPELENKFLSSNLSKYFIKQYDLMSNIYSSVYQVNLSGIWESYYKNMSYPSFKHSLFTSEEQKKLKHAKLFEKFTYASGIEIILKNGIAIDDILSEYKKILSSFEQFINEYKLTGKQFTVTDLGNHFMRSLKISDKFKARAFAQTIINSAFEFGKIKEIKFISERINSIENNPRYSIHQDGDIYSKFILRSVLSSLKPDTNFVIEKHRITLFHIRSNPHSQEIDSKITALGIGEARGLLDFLVIGGNNPQIYIRMNSISPLEKAIKQGDFYQNGILKDVQLKHYISVEMLKFLFKKSQPETTIREKILNYSDWFWNNIENYFMGILPNEVLDSLSKTNKK